MKNTHLPLKKYHPQQGMALVISMILLLLITLLGVSAARMSNLDVKVAGNTVFSGLVFQGTESALGKMASDEDLFNIGETAKNRGVLYPVPPAHFLPAETVSGGATLNQKGSIQFERDIDGLQLNVAYSSLIPFQIYRMTANSNLAATSAKDKHTEGRAIIKTVKTP